MTCRRLASDPPFNKSAKVQNQNPNPFQKQNQFKIQSSDLKAPQEIERIFLSLAMNLNLNSIVTWTWIEDSNKIEIPKIQVRTDAIQNQRVRIKQGDKKEFVKIWNTEEIR